MLCLLFLSPVITGQHSEEAEDVRRIPEQGLHSGSVALWDLDVGSSVIGIGRMNFGLWWHDESSGAQTEGLTLCCFWRNGGVKGPFCFSHSFLCLPMRLEHALKVEQAHTGTRSGCCWVKILCIEQEAVQKYEFVTKSSYILPGNRWEAFSCKNTALVCTKQTKLTNQTGLIFFLLCILQPLSHVLKTSV